MSAQGTVLTSPAEVTALLVDWTNGDESARERLLPLVYKELRKIAAVYFQGESRQLTLQPTALVHEAYLRILGQEKLHFQCRAQFFAFAGREMRRVLIDYARRRKAEFRGGKQVMVVLEEALGVPASGGLDSDRLLALDEVLRRLEVEDARAANVVVLRFYSGMTHREIAEYLEISRATVKRDWTFARHWLARELKKKN